MLSVTAESADVLCDKGSPMSKQRSSVRLQLCHPRAEIPGGTKEERERDFHRIMREEGPYLIKEELKRIRPVDPAPNSLLNRIFQAVDILLGRGHVYVERRHPR
jgi:hypothetical protein